MERWQFSNVSSAIGKAFLGINNINFCRDTLQSKEVEQDRSHDVRNRVSVDNAPDVSSFYGRAEELNILEKWIVEERCRLVAIVGISGIGKTALAVKLLERIQDKFEYVIWQSLRYSPPLEAILRNLIQFLSDRSETDLPVSIADRLSLLMEYLRKSRCLIILDDVQMVLSSGQLAGNYKSGYEDYGELFRTVAEFSHNSCLVMNSWEPPKEIVPLKGDTAPIRSLQLNGLGVAAVEILREQGLVEEDKWEYLINTYAGNPLWLKIVATMIQELFGGRVSEFLKYDTLVLGNDLTAILHRLFNRLSDLEKKVMYRVASEESPVSISQLLEDIKLSPSELFNGIQSLGRRSLIEKATPTLIEKKEQSNETLFAVQPVVRQYVKTQYAGNDG